MKLTCPNIQESMRLLLTAIAWIGVALPSGAGVYTQTRGPVSLDVRYDGEARKISLSDLITVTVTIEGSQALKTPIAPLDLPAASPWVLVERSSLEREVVNKARVRYRLTYRFGPREPGKKVVFQFPDVRISDGDSAEQTVTWAPIAFEVETQIAQPDRSAARDITAIEEMPPLPAPDRYWQLAFGSAGVLAMVIALVVGVRLVWRRRAPRMPAQMALYELQRLVVMRLPEQGRSERFITLLTMLVRRYLERAFALPARRQTTPEFLRDLDQVGQLSAAEKQFLTSFLQQCETVKFAQQAMPTEDCLRWAEAARAFLASRSDGAS